MSPKQTPVYFRLWQAAWKAQWRLENGTPQILASASSEARQIDAIASRRARLQHRAPNLDDIRHATHVHAIGRDRSSKDLTQDEIDRVWALFRMLAAPEDLGAIIGVQNPQSQARLRTIHGLEHCGVPEVRLQQWSAYFNGGRTDWRDLPEDTLKAFSRYVWSRAPKRAGSTAASPTPAKPPAPVKPKAPDLNPYDRSFNPYGPSPNSGAFGARYTGD